MRCLAATAEHLGGVELRNSVGTVERIYYCGTVAGVPAWLVHVARDGAPTDRTYRHGAGELAPA